MIGVTGEVEFEDAQFFQILNAIKAMDATTAQEPGCIAYKSSLDATNPNILRIYEMWEMMAALDGLNAKAMDAKVYEVSRKLPFPNQA